MTNTKYLHDENDKQLMNSHGPFNFGLDIIYKYTLSRILERIKYYLKQKIMS